ncbi:glucose-6-phosphate isomerase [Leucobacter luti]|uniref:glucose-6-phosphate isomerase n=1 Tax=Leucobacter luti TaxID=340320 RepID=UPI003D0937B3
MTLHLTISEDIAAAPGFHEALGRLVEDRVASRIFALDAGLWGEAAEAEAAARLGWTDFSEGARAAVTSAESLRAALADEGVDRIVLCGMGGSSLAPAVISRWSGVELVVIDSTHPTVVRRAVTSELARTAVVISSKSGGTIETLSHRATFARAFADAGIDPASRIIVVTDPGSPLEASALEAGQRVCNADPDVGGRFSALTAFGLVPAGLAGADIRTLVGDAESIRGSLTIDDADNPALRLAAALAAGLPGRYVLGIDSNADARWGLGAWIEQLVAESTGKEGLGVLPISLPEGAPELSEHADSLLLVRLGGGAAALSIDDGVAVSAPLGAQFLLWSVATAALGRLMGIDPFNQPDVESAKVAAREVLADPAAHPEAAGSAIAGLPGAALLASPADATIDSLDSLAAALESMVPAGGYLAIQAYLDPESPARDEVIALRDRLAARLGVPVSLGWGPSYLHSVGQLHKGGPRLGAFLQLCDAELEPLSIPGSDADFATLIAAQARGDRAILRERGRPVIAISSEDPGQTAAAL